MSEHELKVWPPYFLDLASGKKNWEFRRNDRNFCQHDTLYLREWDPATRRYSGRSLRRHVEAVTDLSAFGAPGFVIMELRP